MADGGRFASVTVRHFGGRHHEAWRQGDFSESIVRLRGFRSRRSVTGGAEFKAEPQPPARNCSTGVVG
jgi:hypothetical protein